MNKVFFSITFFCFTSIFANQDYIMKVGNDVFGMNFFDPIDDARTFNISNSSVLIEKLRLNLNYYILTDRNYNKRLDEAELTLSYPLNINKYFKLKPSAGVILAGDLKGGDIQNSFHKMMNIYTVDSEYDEGKVYISPLLQIDLTNTLPMAKKDNWRLDVVSVLSGYYSFSHNSCLSLISGLSLNGNNFNFDINYGYSLKQHLNNTGVINYVNSIEDQGIITFHTKVGILEYKLLLYPNGNYANGTFSITFGGIPKKSSFNKFKSKLHIGIESKTEKFNSTNYYGLTFTPLLGALSRIEFDFSSTYGWSNPNYKDKTLFEPPFNNGTHYNKFSSGFNFKLLTNNNPFLIHPYIGTNIGLELYHYYKEYNKDDQKYDDIKVIPIYEVKIGTTIFLPQLYRQNVKYGIDFAYKYRDALNENKFNDNTTYSIAFIAALDI